MALCTKLIPHQISLSAIEGMLHLASGDDNLIREIVRRPPPTSAQRCLNPDTETDVLLYDHCVHCSTVIHTVFNIDCSSLVAIKPN